MVLRKILINPIRMLAEHGKLSGILLVIMTLLSLLLSNSESAPAYLKIWETEIGFGFLHKSILHWVNDGLMPVFFLLVGIEIKREMVTGELSRPKQAMLPVVAAMGGILLPALIYFIFNHHHAESIHGWAIPTATDIAFSLGVLSLLGKKIPFALKVFLTALAIIDDLAAIVIIAFFYTSTLNLLMILLAGVALLVMILMNRLHVRFMFLYLFTGALLWFFMLLSGIHPTIAGVLAAFAIPSSLAEDIENKLNMPVYYFILPIFALANTAIPVSLGLAGNLTSPTSLGIILGLSLGKPFGIFLATFLMIKTGMGVMPTHVNWKYIIGMGCVAGIGFTMSLFISGLSFSNDLLLNTAKLSIIIGSLISSVIGLIILGRGPDIIEENAS